MTSALVIIRSRANLSMNHFRLSCSNNDYVNCLRHVLKIKTKEESPLVPKLESKISARLKHMNTDQEVLNVLRLINQISKQSEDKQEY